MQRLDTLKQIRKAKASRGSGGELRVLAMQRMTHAHVMRGSPMLQIAA
jgi:hypothetical protein